MMQWSGVIQCLHSDLVWYSVYTVIWCDIHVVSTQWSGTTCTCTCTWTITRTIYRAPQCTGKRRKRRCTHVHEHTSTPNILLLCVHVCVQTTVIWYSVYSNLVIQCSSYLYRLQWSGDAGVNTGLIKLSYWLFYCNVLYTHKVWIKDIVWIVVYIYTCTMIQTHLCDLGLKQLVWFR